MFALLWLLILAHSQHSWALGDGLLLGIVAAHALMAAYYILKGGDDAR